MKNIIKKGMVLVSSCIFLTACEKVIDIDLDNTEPRVVIEAAITDAEGPYPVYISKTSDYFEPGKYPAISNGLVIISDDTGVVDTCIEIEPGFYQTNKIEGKPDSYYSLFVEAEGKTYTAETYMPEKVELDSITYMFTNAVSPESNDGYLIKCQFVDPVKQDNYYRIKTYKNGDIFIETGNEIVIWDDVLFDGVNADIPAKRGGDMFSLNDTISVELLTIDKKIFQYYTSLVNSLASGSEGMGSIGKKMIIGAAAPANPPTNLSNGAVGYFAAYCISKQSIIIE
jgi:hypothetical protein